MVFIVVGFVLFIGFLAGGIYRMAHHGCPGQPCCQHEMMMKNWHHGMPGCCSPFGMDKNMCPQKPGCMPHDSMMKGCCKHMGADSLKMPVPKK